MSKNFCSNELKLSWSKGKDCEESTLQKITEVKKAKDDRHHPFLEINQEWKSFFECDLPILFVI